MSNEKLKQNRNSLFYNELSILKKKSRNNNNNNNNNNRKYKTKNKDKLDCIMKEIDKIFYNEKISYGIRYRIEELISDHLYGVRCKSKKNNYSSSNRPSRRISNRPSRRISNRPSRRISNRSLMRRSRY